MWFKQRISGGIVMSKKLLASLLSALTFLGYEASAAGTRSNIKSNDTQSSMKNNPKDSGRASNAKILEGINATSKKEVSSESSKGSNGKVKEASKKELSNDEAKKSSVNVSSDKKNSDKAKDTSKDLSSDSGAKIGSGKGESSSLKKVAADKVTKLKQKRLQKLISKSVGVSARTMRNYKKIREAAENDPGLRKKLAEYANSKSLLRYSKHLLWAVPTLSCGIGVSAAPGLLKKNGNPPTPVTKTVHSFAINANVDPITALGKETTVGKLVRAWAQYLKNYNSKIDNSDNRIGHKAYDEIDENGNVVNNDDGNGKEFDDLLINMPANPDNNYLKQILDLYISSEEIMFATLLSAPGGIFGPIYFYDKKSDTGSCIGYKDILSNPNLVLYDASEEIWKGVIGGLKKYFMSLKEGKYKDEDVDYVVRQIYRFLCPTMFVKLPLGGVGEIFGFGLIRGDYLGTEYNSGTGEVITNMGKEVKQFGWGSTAVVLPMIRETFLKEIFDKNLVSNVISIGKFHDCINEIVKVVYDVSSEPKLNCYSGFWGMTGLINMAVSLKDGSFKFGNSIDKEKDGKVLGIHDKKIEKKKALIDGIFGLLDPDMNVVELLDVVEKYIIPRRNAIRTLDLAQFDDKGLIDAIIKIKNPKLTREDFVKGVKEILKLLQSS